MGSETTKIYRYANPIRKVVLRNVPPFINDDSIIKALEKYGEVRPAVIRQNIYGLEEEF